MRNLNEMMEDFFKFSERNLESCLPKEPLTKLDGSGKASILNYNLPQATCFTAVGYTILPVVIEDFVDVVKNKPQTDFWDKVADLSVDEVADLLKVSTKLDAQGLNNELLEFESLARQPLIETAETVEGVVNETLDELETFDNNLSVDDVAEQVSRGYRPYYRRNLYGKKMLKYVKKPTTVVPQIVIVEHYRVCSYLGNYGAGKTLKTFSLLPGEKTEITLRTYKHSSEVKTKSENVLDSFSEESTKELEQFIENTKGTTDSFGETITQAIEASYNASLGADVGIPIKAVMLNLGLDLGVEGKISGAATQNSARNQNIKELKNALDRHVASSSSVREVEVNTETTTTVETGEETTISRTLENINKSRVLNFVFRQLLQEYFTITYLEDITLVFTNGYPESTFSAKLDSIDGFLSSFVKDSAKKDELKAEILNELSSVYDYQGTRQRFVEKVTHKIYDIDDNEVDEQHYYRKKKDLSQTYRDKTVPGVILDVQHRMLRTDSVIVDALLGQGEALDCFNLRLQEAANMKAYIETFSLYLQQLEKQQAMEIIDGIENPEAKADLYKRVFGDCCKEVQTTFFHNDEK